MVVRSTHQPEWYPRLIQRRLQCRDALADRWSVIMVDAGKDMGRAGHDGDALCNLHARHFQGYGQIWGAIIHSGQDMAMQIDHWPHQKLSGSLGLCAKLNADASFFTTTFVR